MIFVVGGSFFLREFKTVRYEFRKQKQYRREELFPDLKDQLVPEKELTLEAQYEKALMQNLWGKNWENKRIDRPYDEETEVKS